MPGVGDSEPDGVSAEGLWAIERLWIMAMVNMVCMMATV